MPAYGGAPGGSAQQTLDSVVAVVPPAPLHLEAPSSQSGERLTTPSPASTLLLEEFPFLKRPSPSTAWPKSVASLLPGPATPPLGSSVPPQAGREGPGHLALPLTPHPSCISVVI